MPTPSQVQTHQADGYVERDPSNLSIDEMYGRADTSSCSGSCYSEFEEGRAACRRHGRPNPAMMDDDSEIVPESCDADDDEPTLQEYADAAERRMTRCET